MYSVHEEDGYVDICILKIGEVKESLSAVMITVEHTAFCNDKNNMCFLFAKC